MVLVSSRANRKRITHNGKQYEFRNEFADYVINFFERLLSHGDGRWAGQPFELIDYQETFLSEVFGWVDSNGHRMVRTAYLEVPKKNGKSPLAAGVGLYLTVADREPGANVIIAAADKEQAGIVYGYARGSVVRNQELRRRLKVIDSRKRIVDMASGSVMVAVSSDVASKHGPSIHGLIFDELHAQRNRDLWDTLATGTGARDQPLTVAITTAGTYDEAHICWEQHQEGLAVCKNPLSDPGHFAMMYSAERDEDWRDEKVWAGCNPALGVFRNVDQLRQMKKKAERSPAFQNTFRRLFLNQWTQQVERWLDIEEWKACAGPSINEEDLHGEVCYSGLDLSSTTDMTALVHLFPDEPEPGSNGPVYFDTIARFWLPVEGIQERERNDGVPYTTWAEEGWLTLTPGSAIDYDWVISSIASDYRKFYIREMAVDRWGAQQVSNKLMDKGIEMVEFGQGYVSMNAPMQELLRVVMARRLRHGDNPILNWMAECLSVRQDPAGNIKPVKPDRRKTSKRIDGMVALTMALGRAMLNAGPSVYAERGLLTV